MGGQQCCEKHARSWEAWPRNAALALALYAEPTCAAQLCPLQLRPLMVPQASEYELLDWRLLRRPLPGANPRAFEPPLQPIALLLQQQAVRAARSATAARAQRAVLQRQHLKQHPEQQQPQQPQQQVRSAPLAATIGGTGSAANGAPSGGHAAPAQLLHPVNPFLLKREQNLATAPGQQQQQQQHHHHHHQPQQQRQPMDVDGAGQQQQQQLQAG